MRRQYDGGAPLEAADLDPDPMVELRRWLEAAVAAGAASPNAMVLSTVDAAGQPQSRFVLLRRLDARGLGFFTNYTSPKARELEAHPQAALTFGWLEAYRQARATGSAERMSAEESDAYFASRPRATQIGAWASAQSEVIRDRATLLGQVARLESKFAGRPVPRPPDWGGIVVLAQAIEFWQGQPDRLHDRLRYRRASDGWILERLSP